MVVNYWPNLRLAMLIDVALIKKTVYLFYLEERSMWMSGFHHIKRALFGGSRRIRKFQKWKDCISNEIVR